MAFMLHGKWRLGITVAGNNRFIIIFVIVLVCKNLKGIVVACDSLVYNG
jgi:hypothetical protein